MKISINKLQQFPRILFTITLFSILAACGGSSSSSAPPTPPDVPTDASLKSLTLSIGALSPAFSSDVVDYTLATTKQTTTVTPTASQATATVKVNDSTVDSGSASESITLKAGETKIEVVVTAADKIATRTYAITVNRIASVEFINPKATDAANQKFGEKVVSLSNGNIVVYAPGYGTDKGAVHFYKPTSSTAVASFYGDKAGDQVGSGGIIALANDNFLIVSPFEDKGELRGAGSVRLVNGTTGDLMETITGDGGADVLANGGITLLNDNQFVITSPEYQNNDQQVGSVQVIDDQGKTVKALYGGEFGVTRLGSGSVTALSNNNFVIVSGIYTHNGKANAGKVLLVNSKGEVLKSITGQGKKANEGFGDSGITPLNNGNFLIATRTHDASDSLTNAGAIELINGSTGAFISRLVGDKKDGYLGLTSGDTTATTTITTLANSNYVVMHHTADNGATQNAGSVRLFSGVDGNEIIFPSTATATGTPLFGNATDDFKKNFTQTKITALANSNYVVTAPFSDKTLDGNATTDVGSIRLMNGNTGEQLSIKHSDRPSYQLGYGDVIELSNHKYVVASPFYNDWTGSVMLFNDKGVLEGTLVSSVINGLLGSAGLTALGNNKFVIASQDDSDKMSTVGQVGSTRLLDANVVEDGNIKQIAAIYGDDKEDYFGSDGVTLLNNHHFVFAAPNDDVNGIADAGSVQAVNGTTGVANAADKIVGTKAGDMNSAQMIKPATGDYFILSQPLADDNDKVDVGKVRLVVPTF